MYTYASTCQAVHLLFVHFISKLWFNLKVYFNQKMQVVFYIIRFTSRIILQVQHFHTHFLNCRLKVTMWSPKFGTLINTRGLSFQNILQKIKIETKAFLIPSISSIVIFNNLLLILYQMNFFVSSKPLNLFCDDSQHFT